MRVIFFILFSLSLQSNATNFYVATNGTSVGDGSIGSPWDLQTALSNPVSVVAGSTVYMLAGTYTDTYTSSLTGTVGSPIRVIAIGRVILDGTLAQYTLKDTTVLTINGAYTWYVGLEITNSDPARTITQSGSNPPERRGGGIDVFGIGVKVINCIIYDTGQGLGAWTPSTNSEFYGNVIYNNGWDAPDRLHGHGIYTQNDTGLKSFKDNITLNNFVYGVHLYTEEGEIKNFYFEGNVIFNDGCLMGGAAPVNNMELNTNYFYESGPSLGYSLANNTGLTLTNNFFAGGISILYFTNVTATGNTIFSRDRMTYLFFIYFPSAPNVSTWAFDNNTYYWKSAPAVVTPIDWINTSLPDTNINYRGLYTLPQWQALGQDANATVTRFPVNPGNSNLFLISGKKTVVRQNEYDANRAEVVIYNWDLSSTVNINVSGILSSGDTYELRNVEDYFGDVLTGTFAGGDSLSVPMTGHTVALPLGYGSAMGPNTFPEFGTFVLIKTGSTLGVFLKSRNIIIQ